MCLYGKGNIVDETASHLWNEGNIMCPMEGDILPHGLLYPVNTSILRTRKMDN